MLHKSTQFMYASVIYTVNSRRKERRSNTAPLTSTKYDLTAALAQIHTIHIQPQLVNLTTSR